MLDPRDHRTLAPVHAVLIRAAARLGPRPLDRGAGCAEMPRA